MVTKSISIVLVLALLTAGVTFSQGEDTNLLTTVGENLNATEASSYIAFGGTLQTNSNEIAIGAFPILGDNSKWPPITPFDAAGDVNAGVNAAATAQNTTDTLLYVLLVSLAVVALIAAIGALSSSNP
ncbi:MAG: hypothetical protein ABSG38_15865 [Spirochaetia bacterium]|jgi:hypothetical protein